MASKGFLLGVQCIVDIIKKLNFSGLYRVAWVAVFNKYTDCTIFY